VYAFVLPVIDTFVAAYIMRNTNGDITKGRNLPAHYLYRHSTYIFIERVFVESILTYENCILPA
jgi:hypothetical protein